VKGLPNATLAERSVVMSGMESWRAARSAPAAVSRVSVPSPRPVTLVLGDAAELCESCATNFGRFERDIVTVFTGPSPKTGIDLRKPDGDSRGEAGGWRRPAYALLSIVGVRESRRWRRESIAGGDERPARRVTPGLRSLYTVDAYAGASKW
jgi:hypothetical protein